MQELTLEPKRILPALRSSRLGRNMSNEELVDLFSYCKLRAYEPGETIISEGDLNKDMYVVVKNSVIVEIGDADEGNLAYVDTLAEGEIIGETALFVNAKRTANVRAADDAEVLVLERSQFFSLLSNKSRIGVKLLFMIIYSLLGRLRAANQELAFERRMDSGQAEIDDLIAQMLPEDAFRTIFKPEGPDPRKIVEKTRKPG